MRKKIIVNWASLDYYNHCGEILLFERLQMTFGIRSPLNWGFGNYQNTIQKIFGQHSNATIYSYIQERIEQMVGTSPKERVPEIIRTKNGGEADSKKKKKKKLKKNRIL